MILHAGLIAMRLNGGWRGVLITGDSGSGKSDLALRAMEHGFRLVADDRVLAWTSQERLFGRAPDPLAGLLESRGLGVLSKPHLAFSEISFVVRCVDAPDVVERLPDPTSTSILDVALPSLELWPFDVAAPLKLLGAMQHLGARLR